MADGHVQLFGEIEGHPVGSVYAGRREAMYAGLHQNWVSGISGNREIGANCVALNKGYADDEDHGDWVLYTGAGGNDSSTKRQVADQDLDHRHNAALVHSEENGLPVRVLRGYRGERPYAPNEGYRYDGLYKVAQHWSETGIDGFRIWRFLLVRLTPDEARPWTPIDQTPAAGPVGNAPAVRTDFAHPQIELDLLPGPPEGAAPLRVTGIVQRVVRSTRVSQFVKRLYRDACQVCGLRLDLRAGRYSEGAHIRGLGRPHNGPDVVSNVLCLCPNHHVLFDAGAIFVDAELMVRDHRGDLMTPLRVPPPIRLIPPTCRITEDTTASARTSLVQAVGRQDRVN